MPKHSLPQDSKLLLYVIQLINIQHSYYYLRTTFQNKNLMKHTLIVEPLFMIKSFKVMLVELSGCINQKFNILKELNNSTMKSSDLITMRIDEFPSVRLIFVMCNPDEGNCLVIIVALFLI